MQTTLLKIAVALLAVSLGACASHAGPNPQREPRVSVLVEGAAIKGANGIRFDAADRLHVASVFGREVVVMDPEDGTILDRYTAADGIEGPDDLAFGADGSLFWTSIVTGEVGRRWPDGRTATIAQLPPGPNPIAMSENGRLMVALCFFGDALYEVDPEGQDAPRLLAENLGGGCGFNGFDFGPGGQLYAPGFFRDEVVRVDIDDGTMTSIASGFGIPNALKFDADGRLHQLDTQRGELWRIDVASGEKVRLAEVPPNTDNLAFDSRGRLFISGADSGQIAEVRPDGTLRVVSPGGLTTPGGIARVGDSLFVADHFSLVELDPDTGARRSVETSIVGVSDLAEPLTVASNGDGTLIVSSFLANTVQVWDPSTREVVVSHPDFAVPMNAIAFRGGIAVAELGTGSVAWQPQGGKGEREVLLPGLAVPMGMASDGDQLFVADWQLGTVTRWTPGDAPEIIARELDQPEGLAVAPNGDLLVVESGAGRLTRIAPETGEVHVVAEDLALGADGIASDILPPTWLFNGVTIDTDGTIYVTGDIDNLVYRIAPTHEG